MSDLPNVPPAATGAPLSSTRLEVKFALTLVMAALPFAAALWVMLAEPGAIAVLSRYWVLLAGASLVAVVTLAFLRRDLRLRVRELHEAARALADGEVARLGEPALGSDVPGLVAQFNRMAGQIERQRRELAGSLTRFRQFAEMSSDWYWETGPDHRFTTIEGRNSSVGESLIGNWRWSNAMIKPLSMTWEEHRAVLDRHEPFRDFLIEFHGPGGALTLVEVNGDPVIDEQGNFQGYRGTSADVTRVIGAEARAVRNEARFRGLIQDAPEAIVVADFRSGLVVEANLAAATLFGCPREALIGASAIELSGRADDTPETRRSELVALARRALAGERVVSDWWIKGADGRRIPVESRWMRLPGEEQLLRASLVDISDRHAAEAERARLQQELADRLAQLRLTVDSMPYACVINGADLAVQSWNPAAERMFGWSATEMIGRNSLEIIVPPEARAAVNALFERMASGEPTTAAGNQNLTRDGRRITCEWSNSRLTDAAGRFVGYLSMAIDVTARLAAERSLQESERRFRQLTALSSDWYWEQDAEFRFTLVTGEGSVGHQPHSAALGSTRWERPYLKPVGTTWDTHRRDLEAHRPFSNLVQEYTGPDGLRHYWSVNGEPVFSADGRFTGYRGVGADVTGRHRGETMRAGDRRLFELLTSGAQQAVLLDTLCSNVEAILVRPGVAIILEIAGGRLRFAAGPGAPAILRAALADGLEPGQAAAAFGVQADHGEAVVCRDVASDPRWEPLRAVAAECGIAASWSTPVRAANGEVIAVLAVHHAVAAEPVDADLDLAASNASLAGVLIERFRSEAELRASESRFRQLTLLSSDWYWEQDRDFRFVRTDVLGYRGGKPLGESEGHTRWERAGTRPIGTTWEAHRRDLEAHRPFAHLVLELTLEDGTRSYVAVRGEPMFDHGGEFSGYRGVGSDISERYRSDLIRAGERKVYEMLAAGAPLRELLDVLCTSIEEALARPGFAALLLRDGDMLRDTSGPHAPAAYREAIAGGVAIGPAGGSCGVAAYLNEVVVSADIASDPRWEQYREVARTCGFASAWSTPVLGAAGEVVATFAVYRDSVGQPVPEDLELTRTAAALAGVLIQRFRAQAAQQELDSRYRSLIELAQEGVLIHHYGVVEYANPALARILRVPRVEDLLGTNIFDRYDPASLDLARRRQRRIMEMAQSVGYAEMRIRADDGQFVDVETAGGPVEISGRRLVQSYVRDISGRKWAEREMQRLNESLENKVAERTAELSTAVRELEAFSYTVAHDLRAPLRAVDGYAQLLRADAGAALDEGARRDIDLIIASARRMAELIDGLLEFSRLSRGTASYQRIPTRAVVLGVVKEAEAAFAHGPEVRIGELPDVFGDPAMLRQVWSNLVFNAFKFTSGTPGARIAIDSEVLGGEVVFSVADNGAGFDADYAGKLFGMFQRLHSRAEFEGTGVGLAIVKRIVERHHGRVWAEGATGRGATLRFSMPLTSVVMAPAEVGGPAGAGAEAGGGPAPGGPTGESAQDGFSVH